MKEIFAEEFDRATQYNLSLTEENWEFIME